MKLIPVIFFILLSLFGVFHLLALRFFLYWQIPWFDIPMHLLGGATIVFWVFSLTHFGLKLNQSFFRVGPILLFVFLLAVTWEVSQYVFIEMNKPNYILDTLSDLFFSVLGGGIGFWLVRRFEFLETSAGLSEEENKQ